MIRVGAFYCSIVLPIHLLDLIIYQDQTKGVEKERQNGSLQSTSPLIYRVYPQGLALLYDQSIAVTNTKSEVG